MSLIKFQEYLEANPEISASDLYEALWDGKVLIENVPVEKSKRLTSAEYAEKYKLEKGTRKIPNLVATNRVDSVKTPDGLRITDVPPQDKRPRHKKVKNVFDIKNFTPLFVTSTEFSQITGIGRVSLCTKLRRGKYPGSFRKKRTHESSFSWIIPVELLQKELEEEIKNKNKKEMSLQMVKKAMEGSLNNEKEDSQ